MYSDYVIVDLNSVRPWLFLLVLLSYPWDHWDAASDDVNGEACIKHFHLAHATILLCMPEVAVYTCVITPT